MIISGSQIQKIMKVYAEQTKVGKVTKSQGSSPTSKKDEVILSSQAQGFGQIYQALKAIPDVRTDKVAEFSSKIESGDYSVDAKDVAEKMVGRVMADGLR
jgi:negative regulator of flagellin synthesis FlgM